MKEAIGIQLCLTLDEIFKRNQYKDVYKSFV